MLSCLFLTGCGTAQKEVRLAFKFPLDKIYHYVYNGKISSTAYENGKLAYSGDRTDRITYTQEVVEMLDSTLARLRYIYSMAKDAGGGGDARAKTWTSEFTMANNGKIVDFSSDENSAVQSRDYFRYLFEQASSMYPEQSVPVGYSWTHSVKVISDTGATDASTTYKVKALVREAGYDCAVIEYKGNMIIPIAEKQAAGSSGVTSGTDRIEVNGVVYFAYTQGIIIKQDESSRLMRTGTMSENGKSVEFKIDERRSYTSSLKQIENK